MQNTAARPLGVTILAVLAIIGGLLGLFGAFTVIALGGATWLLVGLVSLVQSLAALAFGFGAWTLRPWAWSLGIIVYGVNVILDVVYLIGGNPSSIVSLIIAGIILYYLFTPGVKAAFGKA
jgi:hypothetical protein